MSAFVNIDAQRIPVALSHQPYEVVIGGEGLRGVGKELRRAGLKEGIKVLVVSNADVAEPYGDLCLQSLRESGYRPTLLVIEAGEDQKTPVSVSLIHDAAYEAKLERGSLMVALGGGVVGDMTGFAAATWLRGISVVQLPTTLLAMVDAAIGGKTGVNHPGGKNLIGAFHQPRLVLIDPSTLKTLPEREFRAGMAEVIKYGVIGDSALFQLLEGIQELNTPSQLHQGLLEKILERSALAKSRVVSSDEREGGLRAILNYGHTFGHVVETLCGYGTWLHGEAVAIGMVAVGELAVLRQSWNRDDANRQKSLIAKAGLPIAWPKLDPEEVLYTLQGDKKVKDGKLRFVIPTGIGNVEIKNDVSREEIRKCLSELS
ncbi:MAG: 3-dehydroquinate synthase [Prochlorococcus sp. MED-G132]|nr:MAG: 3-dehydroquinate synthase [Prochlorococcus sp. MED-G132]